VYRSRKAIFQDIHDAPHRQHDDGEPDGVVAARRDYIGDPRGLPLPTLEALDAVPVDRLPALIMQLAALAMRAATRLAQTPRPDSGVPECAATPDHLSTKAAAAALGISPTAVRRLEAAGELPAVRIGRRVLFRRDTLERFGTERERPAGGTR
jgi:excisionase family DNA binding protein